MKLTDLATFVVANPPPSFGGRYFVFVRLTTDGGVRGYGEVYSAPFHPDVVVAALEDTFERSVAGLDPFRTEELFRRVYTRGYAGRPGLLTLGVLSALEMACWDIVGKELHRPVHDLLGGRVRERLRAYTYIYPEPGDTADAYRDPELAAERACEYVAQGFDAVKFDPVGPYLSSDPRQLGLETLAQAEHFVRVLRAAVGDACDLLVGTHGQMTPSSAIRLARRLEPFDPLWLEEAVPPERPEAMARVARKTSIPLATGERLATKWEYARVLEHGAAAILQPNLGRCGGLLEAKKIAALAEVYGAELAPHHYGGPLIGAANVQLAACIPNFLILEGIRRWDGFQAELLQRPIRWQDGHVIVPSEPGLGADLDEAVAARHPYEGDALHLDVVDAPGRD